MSTSQAELAKLEELFNKERKTLAGEIHDQTLAELGGLAVELGFLALRASEVSEELKEAVDEVRERLKETDRKLRGIVKGIYPTALSTMALIAAVNSYLNELATRPVPGANGLEIKLEVTGFGEEQLKEEMEIGIYRVIQQGVENVIQHAQAKTLKIELSWTEREVKLALADDGVGFDVENPRESPFTGHFGLASLRDRIERLLGRLEIESEPGRGTTLRARIPVVGEGPRPQESRVWRRPPSSATC